MKPTNRLGRLRSKGKLLLIALLLSSLQIVSAQSLLPLIKASSKTVSIRDGKHFKKDYWAIMPERKPDYYYAEIPEQAHKITFITDQDSFSFDVTFDKEIDFIILLNGKDSCLTRVSAKYKNMTSFNQVKAAIGPDTLPFRLGDSSKIYLRGSLNGSQPLDIQFDLGAGGSLIKKSSTGKVNMNFDQTVTLHNTDGSNQVPSASKNTFQMGNLAWDSISVTVADNMTHREDMIIGNSLFRGKMLEIDYDQMKMIIHDSLPQHAAYYNHLDLALDGGIIPYIPVGLSRPGHNHKGWAMFDTGAYTTILNSRDVPLSYRLWGEFLQNAWARL